MATSIAQACLTSPRRDGSRNGHSSEPCADPANARTTPQRERERECSDSRGRLENSFQVYSKAVEMGPQDLTGEKGCGVHL
ncbi:hypothetical protein BT93_G0945 [Corymbia citriodora subsp. variegata]|nr:hypothetical protein BT93_G0945 [Corymbia citriodora subsp. variegata]